MEEQGKRSRVKVESILSVVSGKPTEAGKVHKLSPLDRAMVGHTIHIVFYYGLNPFLDGPMPSDLGNLRVTLSELLDEYPYVTGRLTREPDGDWQIKFNDAGVRMLQATVDATLDEWLRSADAAEERDLTVWEEMPLDPTFWSPFRVQINKFKCGAVALGLSCTHMHTDITSATMLFKTWSEVHRRQSRSYVPIFQLPPPSTPTPIPSFHPLPPTPTKMATLTMKFSASSVDKLLSRCPGGATPFDVLTALFWSRSARRQPPTDQRSISICLDCRDQAHNPPVPYAYFGNALHFSTLAVDADELLTGGLGQVSGHIHRHVAGMRNEGFSPAVCLPEKEGSRMYGARLTCVNGEHMIGGESGRALMYEAEFKKGEAPLHVSYRLGNVEGEGVIMVMLSSADGGSGRTVTVTLPEEQVVELCKDEEILNLEPIVILCGGR